MEESVGIYRNLRATSIHQYSTEEYDRINAKFILRLMAEYFVVFDIQPDAMLLVQSYSHFKIIRTIFPVMVTKAYPAVEGRDLEEKFVRHYTSVVNQLFIPSSHLNAYVENYINVITTYMKNTKEFHNDILPGRTMHRLMTQPILLSKIHDGDPTELIDKLGMSVINEFHQEKWQRTQRRGDKMECRDCGKPMQ
jgi:hypothetical protein